MKVTAIIPNYNGGRFFKEAIDSLRKQIRQPDSIVVVDGGSTDDSVALIEKGIKESKYPGSISFIKLSTRHYPGGTRNAGIKALPKDCDVVAFLDVDDFYYKAKIEKSLDILEKHESIGLVYSDYDMWYTDKLNMVREFKHPYDPRHLWQSCIVSTNSIVRRDLFDKVGPFKEDIIGGEDYELWLRFAKITMMYHIAEPLFCYRVHKTNVTLNNQEQMHKDILKFKKEMAHA